MHPSQKDTETSRKTIEERMKERRKELGMKEPAPRAIYPEGTIVRIKNTGEMAKITKIARLGDNSFLHYEAEIEGREGTFALYGDNIEVEVLPKIERNEI